MIGLKKIDSKTFVKRINTETLKFFKTLEPDININIGETQFSSKDKISNTNFSFLSPVRVDFPNKSFLLTENSILSTKVDKMDKKQKIIKNINDGDVLKQDKLTEIHSSIMLQKMSNKPITSLFGIHANAFNGNMSNKDKQNENIANQMNVEFILDELMAENFSVTIRPIVLEAEKDKDGDVKLSPIKSSDININKNNISLPDKNKNHVFTDDFNKENIGKNIFLLSVAKTISSKNQKNIRIDSSEVFSKSISSNSDKLQNKKLSVAGENENKTIIGFRNSISEEKLKQIPNQLKSIVLFNMGKGVSNRNSLRTIGSKDVIDKINGSAENKFNFDMLKRLERLSGFEKNRDGEVMIKSSLWKTLNEADYNKLVGKEIICRLSSYEDQDIGIEKNQYLEDSFDDFFILVPPNLILPSTSRPAVTIPGSLIDEIKTTIKDNFPRIDFVNLASDKTNNLTNIINSLDIVERSIGQNKELEDDKKLVKTHGKTTKVSSALVVDVLSAECQTKNTDQEKTYSNIIANKHFSNIVQKPNIVTEIIKAQKQIEKDIEASVGKKCSIFSKKK